ncbi:hypothetical protein FOA52_013407 [Chlamydomonas sp. UWO 241]|nr:hypothetical protein FOA52_013407 [Chlamydomonas sp. UWO 241]
MLLSGGGAAACAHAAAASAQQRQPPSVDELRELRLRRFTAQASVGTSDKRADDDDDEWWRSRYRLEGAAPALLRRRDSDEDEGGRDVKRARCSKMPCEDRGASTSTDAGGGGGGSSSSVPPMWSAPFSLMQVSGLSDHHNSGCLGASLEDLVQGPITTAIVSNFMIDMGWLLEKAPALKSAEQMLVLHGSPLEDKTMAQLQACQQAGVSARTVLYQPTLPFKYGTHHAKVDVNSLRQEFGASLLSEPGCGSAGGRALFKGNQIAFVWPTVDQVRNSNGGWSCGVHGTEASVGKLMACVGDNFCRFDGSLGGIMGRGNALPHIKTFARHRFDGRADWVMVGSHNLSKQAWGLLTKFGQMQVHSCELSVLVTPETESAYRAHPHARFRAAPTTGAAVALPPLQPPGQPVVAYDLVPMGAPAAHGGGARACVPLPYTLPPA